MNHLVTDSVIRSRQHPLIKLIRSLRLKKHRDESERFVCEGERVVRELLRSSWPVERVVLASSARADKEFVSLADTRAIPVAYIQDSLSDYISDTEHSQGVFAVAQLRRRSASEWVPGEGPVPILDGIADPGNLGTIIRTADALGASGVILLHDESTESHCADPFGPKAVRATAGSLFRLPVVEFSTPDDLLDWLEDRGLTLLVATAREGKPPWEIDLTGRIAIALGHETSGISEKLINAAQYRITVPLSRNVESLNVAVSAASILTESLRQKTARLTLQ